MHRCQHCGRTFHDPAHLVGHLLAHQACVLTREQWEIQIALLTSAEAAARILSVVALDAATAAKNLANALDAWVKLQLDKAAGRHDAVMIGHPPEEPVMKKAKFEQVQADRVAESLYYVRGGSILTWSESNCQYEVAWWLYQENGSPAIDRLLAERPFPRDYLHLLPENSYARKKESK